MIERLFSYRSRGLVVAVVSVVILAAIAVVAANAGGGPPAPNVALDGDEAAARVVLSHPLPQVRDTASGLQRVQLTIDQPPPPGVTSFRAVHQSYAKDGRKMARLDVWRGAVQSSEGTPVKLDGRDVRVAARTIPDGTTDVSFLWQSDGLVHQLHINLVNGIDRNDADRIAASVR